jgi:hypothetical protein
VFTARYALSPYIKQVRFVFEGLMTNTALQSQCWAHNNSYLLCEFLAHYGKNLLYQLLARFLNQISPFDPSWRHFITSVWSHLSYVWFSSPGGLFSLGFPRKLHMSCVLCVLPALPLCLYVILFVCEWFSHAQFLWLLLVKWCESPVFPSFGTCIVTIEFRLWVTPKPGRKWNC